MKKRFVCAFLALMLLLGLVPATALSASAASLSVSESAITVLKQLEGYSKTCDGNGYIGYGTLCTEKGDHGNDQKVHSINEATADAALRAELKELDSAVNSFASKNGLSLTQGKHDALVLFSFQNGTAWLNGTGDLRAAVINGLTGSDFLNAICAWNENTADDNRRMVEANMYLYSTYSSTRPSKFIRVTFDAGKTLETKMEYVQHEIFPTYYWKETSYDNNGTISGASSRTYYYDTTSTAVPHLVPSIDGYTFTGWYEEVELGKQKVTKLTASNHGDVLVAGWVSTSLVADNAVEVSYVIDKSQLLSQNVYSYSKADYTFSLAKDKNNANIPVSNYYTMYTSICVDRDLLDESGVRWCRIRGTDYWVKVSNNTGANTANTTTEDTGIDLTVSVTNSYVNKRSSASLYSTKLGTYTYGTKLRIIDTASKDGFLWGQVAKEATGSEGVCWIALMYTDYDTVRNQTTTTTVSTTVVATGFITYNGYVNVRSDAGTDNQIVGALPYGTEVKIYETKYVNGLEWGRTDSGWFCMAYASITRITDTTNTSDVGYISYAFTGTLRKGTDDDPLVIYDAPNGNPLQIAQEISGKVTVTNLTSVGTTTWGKISKGWVKLTDSAGAPIDVTLDTAKYTVTSELTVRNGASTSAARVDTLTKGVEFCVNGTYQVMVVGDTVWGYADKVGETTATYGGWVNLANKYVTRGDAPTIGNSTTTTTTSVKIATIVGADTVRIRASASLTANILGSIPRGTKATILDERNGWYMIDYNVTGKSSDENWVYGKYVEISESTSGSTTDSDSTSALEGTGVGIIANTYSGVNVRATPGTTGALKGKILTGTQVNILEITYVGTKKWGRVEQGWICMDYVQIISDLPQDVLDALQGSTGSSETSSSTTTGAEVAIYTGSVKKAVDVYKTTDVKSEVVRSLEKDANITLHEIVEVETVTDYKADENNPNTSTSTKTVAYWARVNDGYILDPAANLTLDTLDEAVYTVTGSDTLNVRNGAGTTNTIVHKLEKGDQVKVTKLEIVSGNVWGYIEAAATKGETYVDEDGKESESNNSWEKDWNGEGWISLAYTTKGAVTISSGSDNSGSTETTAPSEPVVGSTGNTGSTGYVNNAGGYKYTGKVINTNSVNVRATASLNAAVSTTLKNGASLVIYETVIADGRAWGRCDAGWIYLYYVDLTPVNGAVDARVVYNDNTIAYTDVNCTEVAGTYAKMAVIDIYEIVGKMARTDLGWVNTDNLL